MSNPNYNDGKWHGWNGGKCPVHPESVVEIVGGYQPGSNDGLADDFFWPNVIAFRVITPYREPEEAPREWAFSPDHHVIWYDSETNMVRIKEVKR